MTKMPLPLPLAPFEEYMLVDDRPTHPMCFFIRLRFSGRCNASIFERAAQMAAARHPLLTACVQQGASKRYHWAAASGSSALVHWQDENSVGYDNDSIAQFDLFQQAGLHIVGKRRATSDEILFQFHHSCCDAMGALQFIEDVLVGYAGLNSGDEDSVTYRPVDGRQLQRRASFGLTRWGLLKTAHRRSVGLLGARRFLMLKPAPLTNVTGAAATASLPKDFPTAHQYDFSASETAGLVAAAKRLGTTLNNLLARDLFLAIGDFRSGRTLGDRSEWLRLTIPMNLRSQADEVLPAANVMSLVFLDRQPKNFGDTGALLETIHRQMKLIKNLGLGLTFPLSLRFARSLPGAVGRWRRMSEKQVCRGTAVLSNLVRPLSGTRLPVRDGKLVAGDLVLEGMEFMPPLRPYTNVAIGVLTYADRLSITLNYDSRTVNDVDAHDLLNGFIRRLRESLASSL